MRDGRSCDPRVFITETPRVATMRPICSAGLLHRAINMHEPLTSSPKNTFAQANLRIQRLLSLHGKTLCYLAIR